MGGALSPHSPTSETAASTMTAEAVFSVGIQSQPPKISLFSTDGDVATMNKREKFSVVLSWFLAEAEQAQIRGDAELEIHLARIAQAMLRVQQCDCGLETDFEKCRASVVARSGYPARWLHFA